MFLLDDKFLITQNSRICDLSSIRSIFQEDIGAGSNYPYNYYRPFLIITYLADFFTFRLNSYGFHLTNIVLHIFTALSLCWFVRLRFKNRLLSYLTGILFLTHPIQTESVAYISGRADILAGLFTFLCFCFYLKYLESKSAGDHFSALLCFICALLSKENAIVIPCLMLIHGLLFKQKHTINLLLPFFGILAVYLYIREIVIKTSAYISIHSLYTGMLYFFKSLPIYLKLLIVPVGLHYDYGKPAAALSNPDIIFGIILFLLLIIAVIIYRNSKLVVFSTLWFFFSLAPCVNIFPTSYFMAEHYLYLPLAGYTCIIAGSLIKVFDTHKITAATIASLIILFYSACVINQNKYWSNPPALYRRILLYNQNSLLAYNNLANYCTSTGNYDEALIYYKKALRLSQKSANIYFNMGEAYKLSGNKKEAVKAYKNTLAIDPLYADAYYNLAALEGKKRKGFTYIKKAKQVRPAGRTIKKGPQSKDRGP